VYSITALPACQIRSPLLRFISAALRRFAHSIWQFGRHTDSHHFYDAVRYKSSSYNIKTYTANPSGSVFLKVLRLSQYFQQPILAIAASGSHQAQECKLLPPPPKVKS
jgi:hypothetical protein